jgi:diguanylate cyclase (GGDEF)-like protein/PAS domain S-box-containing protein
MSQNKIKAKNIDPYSILIDESDYENKTISNDYEENLETLKNQDKKEEKKYIKKKIIKKIIHKKKKDKKSASDFEQVEPSTETQIDELEQAEASQDVNEQTVQPEQPDENYIWMYNLVEASTNLMCIVQNQTITYINHNGVKMLDFFAPEEVIGMNVFDMIAPEHHNLFSENLEQTLSAQELTEIELLSAADKKISAQIGLTYVETGDVLTYMLEAIDITNWKKVEFEKQQAEKKLSQIVLHDDLTGLPGKNLFKDRLDMAIARSTRQSYGKPESSIDKIAILLMNIDKLTPINEALGRKAGDHAIRNIGIRLASSFRGVDTIARATGDGFWMVLEGIRTSEDAEMIARRTLGIMYEDMTYKGNNLALSCSIGISLFPDHGTAARDLIRKAKSALKEVKYSGGGFYRLYDEGIALQPEEFDEFE